LLDQQELQQLQQQQLSGCKSKHSATVGSIKCNRPDHSREKKSLPAATGTTASCCCSLPQPLSLFPCTIRGLSLTGRSEPAPTSAPVVDEAVLAVLG